jgi:hypothetical protein
MIPFSLDMYYDVVLFFRAAIEISPQGAPKRTYAGAGDEFAATVQMGSPARTDADGRTFAATPTVVYTAANPAANADDRFTWTDSGGVTRILPVESATKSRGIGGVAWSTVCKETI